MGTQRPGTTVNRIKHAELAYRADTSMTNAIDHLLKSISDFDHWASVSADHRNTDWPTDYPAFSELVQAATCAIKEACATSVVSDETLVAIARVFSLTEEPESLLEVTEKIGPAAMQLLSQIYQVGDASARWQVVSITPRMGPLGIELAEKATTDPDAYVRRRAWQSFKEMAPSAAKSAVAKALGTDLDEDVRELLREISREPL